MDKIPRGVCARYVHKVVRECHRRLQSMAGMSMRELETIAVHSALQILGRDWRAHRGLCLMSVIASVNRFIPSTPSNPDAGHSHR
jgi:alcohol dehydrogenase class IV